MTVRLAIFWNVFKPIYCLFSDFSAASLFSFVKFIFSAAILNSSASEFKISAASFNFSAARFNFSADLTLSAIFYFPVVYVSAIFIHSCCCLTLVPTHPNTHNTTQHTLWFQPNQTHKNPRRSRWVRPFSPISGPILTPALPYHNPPHRTPPSGCSMFSRQIWLWGRFIRVFFFISAEFFLHILSFPISLSRQLIVRQPNIFHFSCYVYNYCGLLDHCDSVCPLVAALNCLPTLSFLSQT